MALDIHSKDPGSGKPKGTETGIQRLLNVFFSINIVHLLVIMGLAYLQRQKDLAEAAKTRSVSASPNPNRDSGRQSSEHDAGESQPLLQAADSRLYAHSSRGQSHSSTGTRIRQSMRYEKRMLAERRRGSVFAGCFAGLILFAWVLFMGTAYSRLGLGKKH